ncbi:hypothetical protein S7711_10083 [Stachybotrys chartarum IBT 7711]|uniref:F-box domain-containing protein n=1 Tax=Stachybotrys chartarum (strain CBS 109288 / IBT 7711) TaxID=1280523 RepID=A0A084AHS1_STACB|nr:hypothetical protein S7711_10083 [Stachybotrys chartarum IBT 7711]KFA51958.1 hypothetical protein S40293_09495 [Stachybotrys chartarum IBT 40293]
MVSLVHLPKELLVCIAKDTVLSSKDRISLLLVSKWLHALTLPLIYATVRLRWIRKPLVDGAISKLLRSLMANRELGLLIHQVSISCGDYFPPSPPYRRPKDVNHTTPIESLDMHHVNQLIDEANVPHSKLWACAVANGDQEAVISLFLCLLPRLKSFSLEEAFTGTPSILSMTLESGIGAQEDSFMTPLLQSVRDVNFSYSAVHVECMKQGCIRKALFFLYLPQLRSLHLQFKASAILPWPRKKPPTPQRLRRLSLSGLREAQAGPLLSILPALNDLTWCPAFDDKQRYLDLDAMSAALKMAIGPLTTLKLDVSSIGNGKYMVHPDHMGHTGPDPHTFLRGTLALESLSTVVFFTAALPLLLGMAPGSGLQIGPSLPRNIEHLVINESHLRGEDGLWDMYSAACALADFLESCHLFTPQLRRLSLGRFRWLCLEIADELVHLGRFCGIEVVFHEKKSWQGDFRPGYKLSESFEAWVWRAPSNTHLNLETPGP